MATTTQDLFFSNQDQSVFKDNTTETNIWRERFEQSFDVPDINVDESLGEVVVIPKVSVKVFGRRITIVPELKIDFDTEFTFHFDANGKIGGELFAYAGLGSLDSEFRYNPELVLSDSLRYAPGTSSGVIDTQSGEAVSGAFDTNPFGVSAYADLLYRFGLDVDMGLRLFGANLIPDDLPALSFDLPEDVPLLPQQTDPGNNSLQEGTWRLINVENLTFEKLEFIFADLVKAGFGNDLAAEIFMENVIGVSPGNNGKYYKTVLDFLNTFGLTVAVDPYQDKFDVKFTGVKLGKSTGRAPDEQASGAITYDLFDLRFNIPAPLPEDDTLQNGELNGSDSDPFIIPRYDIDGFAGWAIVKATGLPIATDYNLSVGSMLSFDLTLLDIDMGPNFNVRQDLDLTPSDLQVTFLFSDIDGTEKFVTLDDGSGPTSVSSWTGDWEDFPELTLDTPTVVTPTYSMDAMAANKTGIELGLGLEFDIGALGVAVKFPKSTKFLGGKKFFERKFGPLIEINLDESDFFDPGDAFFFPFFDKNGIQIGNYSTVAGTPFVLDVDGTDDPGLSGFDFGANISDPVALDDSGFSVDENSFLVVDVDDLLANDYDPDAYDTLSVAGVGAVTDSNGVARGSATLRPDGTILFETNKEFEELGVALLSETVSIEYILQDAVGRTDTGTLFVDVTGVNDLPVAVDDFSSVVVRFDNGDPVIFDEGFGFNELLPNDTDVDTGDTIRVEQTTGLTTALGGTVDIDPFGNFFYTDLPPALDTLNTGEVVWDAFDYTIRDSQTLDTEPGVSGTMFAAFIGGAPLLTSASSSTPGTATSFSASTPNTTPLAGLSVSSTTLEIAEGTTGKIAYVLSAEPAGTVTVDLVLSDNNEATLSTTTLVFDFTNWNLPQIVDVTGTDDGVLDGIQNIDVTATVTSAPADPSLQGQTQGTAVEIDDAPAIIASTTNLELDEDAGTGTDVTVTLARAPAPGTSVTVSVGSSDLGGTIATVVPASLVFDDANWDTGLPVTVTPIDNSTAEVSQIVDITLSVDGVATTDSSYPGIENVVVNVVIDDDENTAPNGAFDEATTAEDTPVDIQPLLNDDDPDGDDLSIASAEALNGSVVINGDTITYTPDADFFGLDIITYGLSDGTAITDTPIEVTVTPVDDGIVTMPVFITGNEDEEIVLDLNNFILDVDNDALTFAVAQSGGADVVENGSISITTDGTATFTPDMDFFNAEAVRDTEGNVLTDEDGEAVYRFADPLDPAFFNFTVSDGITTVEETVVFAIAPDNDTPRQTGAPILETDEDTELVIDLQSAILDNWEDPEGGPITLSDLDFYVRSGNPGTTDRTGQIDDLTPGFFFDEEAMTLTVDPTETYDFIPAGDSEVAEFSYTIADELGGRSEGTLGVTINGVNDAPVANDDYYFGVAVDLGNGLTSVTIASGGTVNPVVIDNDTDVDNDPLSWVFGPDSSTAIPTVGNTALGGSVITEHSIITIPENGFIYQLDSDDNSDVTTTAILFDSFDYTVSDGTETADGGAQLFIVGEDVQEGFFVLNDDLDAGAPQITLREAVGTAERDNLTGPGPAEELMIGITLPPATGTQVRLQIIQTAGLDEFTVDTTELIFTDTDWLPKPVVITAIDDMEHDGTQFGALTVLVDPVGTTDIDYIIPPIFPQIIPVTIEDSDVARVLTTKNLLQLDESGLNDTVGVYLDRAPTDVVVVDVVSNDPDNFAAAPTQLTFTPTNFATPQFVTATAVDDDIRDGLGIEYLDFNINEALTADADYDQGDDAQVLTIVKDNERPQIPNIYGDIDPVVYVDALNASQREGDSGVTDFTFLLTRYGNTSNPSTVAYEVTGIDSTYTADADDFDGGVLPTGTVNFAADEVTRTVTISVAGDVDEELDEWFALNLTGVSNARVYNAFNEATIINDDGASGAGPDEELDLILDAAEINEDGATTARVSRTGDTSAALVVTLTSSDADAASLPSTVTIAAGQTTSADFTISGVDNATEDTLYPVIFASAPGFIGDGETLKVVDTDNLAPIANPDFVITDDITRFSPDDMLQIDVLANDSDPEGGNIEVLFIDTTGLQGQLFENGDDILAYHANGAFDGLALGETATDTFSYFVGDESGKFAETTVTITVEGTGTTTANTPPEAMDDLFYETDAVTPIKLSSVLDNDTDADGDTLRVIYSDYNGMLGDIQSVGDGVYIYDPDGQFDGLGAGQSAFETFTYTITDPRGGTSEATARIRINGIDAGANAGPVAGDDFDATDADTPIVIDATFNDFDSDGDPLSWGGLDLTGTQGTVINNGDGTFDYDPAGAFDDLEVGQSATDSFVYSASDGNGGSDTATVTVTVAGTMDVPDEFGDIRGYVFDDLDGNHVYGTGIDALPSGVPVNLIDANGNIVQTKLTSATGNYQFFDVEFGDYQIGVELPTGFGFVLPNQGTIEGRDSDITDLILGTSDVFTVDTTEIIRLQAGITETPVTGQGDLRGYVFEDQNDNHTYEDAIDDRLTGVPVNLLDAAGNIVASTTTSFTGTFRFEGLLLADYRIQVDAPDGHVFVEPDQGSIEGRDSDITDPVAGTSELVSVDTPDIVRLQAGVVDEPPTGLGDVRGTVFEDLNDNDVLDDGVDLRTFGVVVNLLDATGALVDSTTTSYTGTFKFEGIDFGDYQIEVEAPANHTFVTPNQGSIEGRDSDITDLVLGRSDIFTVDTTEIIRLQAGIEDPPGNTIGSVRGFVFRDVDDDDVYTPGVDDLVQGQLIELRDDTGAVVDTFVTSGVGSYRFDDVAFGTYQIATTLAPGLAFVTPNQGTIEGRDSDITDTVNGTSDLFDVIDDAIVRLQIGVEDVV